MERLVIDLSRHTAERVPLLPGEIAQRQAEADANAAEIAERAAALAKRRQEAEGRLTALGLTADELRLILGLGV